MRDWLIALREQKKYTQKEVAERIYVSQPSYCNIESGARRPSVDTAKRIAAMLDFDWTRFYADENGAV